jgi:hypothetical protein
MDSSLASALTMRRHRGVLVSGLDGLPRERLVTHTTVA